MEEQSTTSEIDGVSSSMNRLNFANVKSLDQVTGSESANHAAPALEGSQLGGNDNMPTRSTENNAEGSVWRQYSYQNARSGQGKPATEYTGWDSQGNPHQRVHAPSTVMSDDYASAKTPASSSKFARVKVFIILGCLWIQDLIAGVRPTIALSRSLLAGPAPLQWSLSQFRVVRSTIATATPIPNGVYLTLEGQTSKFRATWLVADR